MNHLTTWQGRIIWSSRFIGFCLLLIAIVRSGPGYLASGVAALVFGAIADWLIPDDARTTTTNEKHSRHQRTPEHAA